VFRRLLLALLHAASMTLSGVSVCSDSTSPCAKPDEECRVSSDCCDSRLADQFTACLRPFGDP